MHACSSSLTSASGIVDISLRVNSCHRRLEHLHSELVPRYTNVPQSLGFYKKVPIGWELLNDRYFYRILSMITVLCDLMSLIWPQEAEEMSNSLKSLLGPNWLP